MNSLHTFWNQRTMSKQIYEILFSNNFFTFLVISSDNCHCYEEIPYVDLQVIPGDNETKVCSAKCSGSENDICGGQNAVSVYVASKCHFM